MTRIITTFSLIWICFSGHSQIGGLNTYDFLLLSQSARTTALGGVVLAVIDDDINLAYANPSLLNKGMSYQLAVNHNFHLAGISHGYSTFAWYLDKPSLTLQAGALYLDYGEFISSDDRGSVLGSFSGKEVAFHLGASRIIRERLRWGANLKIIRSTLESYNSLALGIDLGVTYHNPDKEMIFSVVLKNIGFAIDAHDIHKEGLPFDFQAGISKRLRYLPFRFMISAQHLQRWNLRSGIESVDDPIFLDQSPDGPSAFSKGVENLFRHLVFGGEFLIGKGEIIRLRMGYNHQRKKDLSVAAYRSLSGFSIGFGIKVRQFKFDYGVGYYHLAGAVNHLSLVLDLRNLMQKI